MKKTDVNMAAELARFIVEKTNHNLFLTGKAGTGKTVFLRDFVAHTKKKVVVLAPTGIAAINANAMTIHSFCRFGLSPAPLGRVREGNDYVLEDEEEKLVRKMDLIIIDEVSMVRADVMDHISEKIRLIRESDKPFGGVQLLLIGDLFQLPPVVTKDDEMQLKTYYGNNYFFFNSNAIKKVGFETICFNKVYRQDNPEFVRILNKARVGDVSWFDCNKLNARFMPDFAIPEDKKFINLVAQRKQADAINDKGLKSLEGDYKSYKALIKGDFPKDEYPTNSDLKLKIGAQVMFLKNDKDKKYVNGAIGEVAELSDESIVVKIGDEKITVMPTSWDSFRYEYDKSTNKVIKKRVGVFTQYPIKPAWAITIHKSQGLSFEHAIIDIPRAFAAGQAYVALSRCRSLEGLVLTKKLNPTSFFTDPLVTAFYDAVDSTAHIERLAKAVGFEPFEWEKENSKTEEENYQTEEDYEEIPNAFDDAYGAASHQIYVYHETASELDGEFYNIIDYIIETADLNIYYEMKLRKKIDQDIAEMRANGTLIS